MHEPLTAKYPQAGFRRFVDRELAPETQDQNHLPPTGGFIGKLPPSYSCKISFFCIKENPGIFGIRETFLT
ncbi:MAG: hypothetical protein A2W90_00835 [Bacteroidetes bacterium GWF2_42_66]|nr:MAG: hypothetical protein A2W92_02185 [Bacteroidetes bacterium GWA2_42_15]OFX99400.1 MAG: hypothetical protein A2W89_12235 [Bacteroidetes bacterium GWE2_42_39]OFY40452.1 MAG: hypothetical protein A2W90_00835 [Bacteroidetes bacterium GWF2_42_66]HBL76926.1 hypothetical protein [Prolixibacteraceae bacterium]HCR90434.1 hypothetical protein [Prolixibacteraceae bacterium]